VSVELSYNIVVFLSSTKNTPQKLLWNIEFFDGQKVTLEVPVIRLAELSVDEIARRDLLPIGQFYLRSFETLTKQKVKSFQEAAMSLLTELKNAIEDKTVPYHVGMQMQDTIRKTMENAIIRSKLEVDLTMTTDIMETLPWIDYREVFAKIEERGRNEGIAQGRNEGITQGISQGISQGITQGITQGMVKRDMEIALKAFGRLSNGGSLPSIISMLKEFDISDDIIESARKQAEAAYTQKAKKRVEPEQ